MSFDIINEYEETMTNLFWQSRRCQLATIPTRGYKGDRHKAVLMLVFLTVSGLDHIMIIILVITIRQIKLRLCHKQKCFPL